MRRAQRTLSRGPVGQKTICPNRKSPTSYMDTRVTTGTFISSPGGDRAGQGRVRQDGTGEDSSSCHFEWLRYIQGSCIVDMRAEKSRGASNLQAGPFALDVGEYNASH